MGYFLLAEIKKAKPVVEPKPTPQPTKTSTTPAQAPVTEVKAENPDTSTSNSNMSGERLPQAGEEKPFPYAATGAGLAVVGLWLLLRRAG